MLKYERCWIINIKECCINVLKVLTCILFYFSYHFSSFGGKGIAITASCTFKNKVSIRCVLMI